MKILLPVDGSKYTRRMLSYIAAHDELLGQAHEYMLFTAVPRLSSRAAQFFDRGTLDAYYQDEAQKVLRSARAFADKQGWTVRSAHAAGHAAEEIAAFAKAYQARPDRHGHARSIGVGQRGARLGGQRCAGALHDAAAFHTLSRFALRHPAPQASPGSARPVLAPSSPPS